MIVAKGMQTHRIYATGKCKADVMRKLQEKYPHSTNGKIKQGSPFSREFLLPEPMRIYKEA